MRNNVRTPADRSSTQTPFKGTPDKLNETPFDKLLELFNGIQQSDGYPELQEILDLIESASLDPRFQQYRFQPSTGSATNLLEIFLSRCLTNVVMECSVEEGCVSSEGARVINIPPPTPFTADQILEVVHKMVEAGAPVCASENDQSAEPYPTILHYLLSDCCGGTGVTAHVAENILNQGWLDEYMKRAHNPSAENSSQRADLDLANLAMKMLKSSLRSYTELDKHMRQLYFSDSKPKEQASYWKSLIASMNDHGISHTSPSAIATTLISGIILAPAAALGMASYFLGAVPLLAVAVFAYVAVATLLYCKKKGIVKEASQIVDKLAQDMGIKSKWQQLVDEGKAEQTQR